MICLMNCELMYVLYILCFAGNRILSLLWYSFLLQVLHDTINPPPIIRLFHILCTDSSLLLVLWYLAPANSFGLQYKFQEFLNSSIYTYQTEFAVSCPSQPTPRSLSGVISARDLKKVWLFPLEELIIVLFIFNKITSICQTFKSSGYYNNFCEWSYERYKKSFKHSI